jgi:protein TonB
MLSHVRSIQSLIVSFAASLVLHALVIASLLFMSHATQLEEPVFTPVRIVNLPQQTLKKLPSIQQPPSASGPLFPERQPFQGPVPTPKKFGKSDEVRLPKMLPRSGKPEGEEQGKETGKRGPVTAPKQTGPLPFLTQRDIDELARKGMPAKKPGDDSVTLDTDEFKFISYNRWLTIKVESVLRYPELAVVSNYHGLVFIRFDIMKDGSLGILELLKSSGYKILDDEALRSIRDSAPFQPLPPEWNMDRYPIRAVVIFYMNQGYIR